MKDWIEPDDNISAFACANAACSYIYLISDPTRMKASPYYDSILYPQVNPNGTYYADDPYWIAYNKVGECREYSELFDFMAQQSGIDSRIVMTDAHQWVEMISRMDPITTTPGVPIPVIITMPPMAI